jgi:hypothetical protein
MYRLQMYLFVVYIITCTYNDTIITCVELKIISKVLCDLIMQ